MKRLLFPYSGEEPLTRKQGLRVILTWVLLFSLPLPLLVIVLELLMKASTQEIISGSVFALFSGAFIFGVLSTLVVVMNNRAAQFRQLWKAQNGRS